MGFFDFLKPKKSELEETMEKLSASIFPKGRLDIDAVTFELMRILNERIGYIDAKNIALRTVPLSRIAKNFDEERLKLHLKGYCLHHFSEQQIKRFHGYLVFLSVASDMYGKSPSEVKCNNGTYSV